MTSVSASQLIYTRVEPAFSPVAKSGFQTVYRGRELSDGVVKAIEERVQCYYPTNSSPRLQFFQLTTGEVVLSHSVAIPSHAEIIDKDRRPGAFLAHALVLSRAEYFKTENYPFAIFDHFNFVEDPEQMVNVFGKANGSANQVTIHTQKPSPPSTPAWNGAELAKLVSLAMNAPSLVENGQGVLFTGQAAIIRETVATALWFVPRTQRLACSFTTCSSRCPTQQGWYWGVGSDARRNTSFRATVVDVEQKRVSGSEESRSRSSFYLDWFQSTVIKGDISQACQWGPTMQQLEEAFHTGYTLRASELEDSACFEFLSQNNRMVWQRITASIASQLSKDVAASIVTYLTRLPASDLGPCELLQIAASQQISPTVLSEIAVSWLKADRTQVPDNDSSVLQRLARQTDNLELLFLASTLCRKADTKGRDEALEKMTQRSYHSVLELLLDPLVPADFIASPHRTRLLRDRKLHQMSDEQYVALAQALITINAFADLVELSWYVDRLDEQHLHQIEKLIKGIDSVPAQFQQVVSRRREALGPRRFFGLL